MRKALVVGINYYAHSDALHGCVDDAHSVKATLERHADGSVNFDIKLLTGTGPSDVVSRRDLRDAVSELFSGSSEIALLYFAGHGHIETTGGYILDSESRDGNDGLPLSEIMTLANQSKAQNKVIILDSCHSGIAGSTAPANTVAELTEGTSILTASTAEQYALETSNGGVFTCLLVDALSGSAANLVGDITPGSIYAHIDQSLGPWEQRPLFKTNVRNFVSLRKVVPPIAESDLRRITEFFPLAGFEFPLDPTYEPESGQAVDENAAVFAILQKYNRVNLVVPVRAPHMYHAAMNSTACKLTVLGEHYRRLVERNRI